MTFILVAVIPRASLSLSEIMGQWGGTKKFLLNYKLHHILMLLLLESEYFTQHSSVHTATMLQLPLLLSMRCFCRALKLCSDVSVAEASKNLLCKYSKLHCLISISSRITHIFAITNKRAFWNTVLWWCPRDPTLLWEHRSQTQQVGEGWEWQLRFCCLKLCCIWIKQFLLYRVQVVCADCSPRGASECDTEVFGVIVWPWGWNLKDTTPQMSQKNTFGKKIYVIQVLVIIKQCNLEYLLTKVIACSYCMHISVQHFICLWSFWSHFTCSSHRLFLEMLLPLTPIIAVVFVYSPRCFFGRCVGGVISYLKLSEPN